jgi:hypothetical protein
MDTILEKSDKPGYKHSTTAKKSTSGKTAARPGLFQSIVFLKFFLLVIERVTLSDPGLESLERALIVLNWN